MAEPKTPAWPIPELWPGATGVILAGGPSLTAKEFRHVARTRLSAGSNVRVFTVNDACYLAWWADWLHASDKKWWLLHRQTAPKFPGFRTCMDDGVQESWARRLNYTIEKHTGYRGGFAEEPDKVATGGHSGYQAIQIAVKTGCAKVLLLGIDMKGTHWFGEHEDRVSPDWNETGLPWFPTIVEPLEERGIEVINCSPNSAVDCFPKAALEDVL